MTVEREAKNGDTVVIDFEGFVDGKAFEGGKAEKLQPATSAPARSSPASRISSSARRPATRRTSNVTFPEDYHSEELAGKAATCPSARSTRSRPRSIKPELDDEFAKDVSEFDTLADLKKDIKARLTKTPPGGV